MGYIYKITNIVNGKVYIGQTSESVLQRWYEHKYSSEHIESSDYDCAIHRAIRKYGSESFNVDTLENVDNDLLNDREMYWISFYDSYKFGYNMTLGGGGSRVIDYNLVYKLWDDGYGISNIADLCDCSDVQAREILKGHANYSKEESFSRGARVNKKGVNKYTLDGVFVRRYDSGSDASRDCNISKSSILATCRFEQTTAGGFQWRFDGDVPYDNVNVGRAVSVKQFYLDGTLKNVFASVSDASRMLGCSQSAIYNACKGMVKSSHGYLWRFYDDDDLDVCVDTTVRVRDRKVSRYTLDGEYISTFNSAKDASVAMGVSYSSIYNACVGTSKSSCGFIWKFE